MTQLRAALFGALFGGAVAAVSPVSATTLTATAYLWGAADAMACLSASLPNVNIDSVYGCVQLKAANRGIAVPDRLR